MLKRTVALEVNKNMVKWSMKNEKNTKEIE